jgi:hypothetical protein
MTSPFIYNLSDGRRFYDFMQTLNQVGNQIQYAVQKSQKLTQKKKIFMRYYSTPFTKVITLI